MSFHLSMPLLASLLLLKVLIFKHSLMFLCSHKKYTNQDYMFQFLMYSTLLRRLQKYTRIFQKTFYVKTNRALVKRKFKLQEVQQELSFLANWQEFASLSHIYTHILMKRKFELQEVQVCAYVIHTFIQDEFEMVLPLTMVVGSRPSR